jgi:acetate kinase
LPVRVLVVNAGSSSVKLSVLDGERLVAGRELAAERTQIDAEELAGAVSDLGPVDAVGHRIVHGGTRFRQATLIDPEVVDAVTEPSALAPLHQAKSLAALAAVSRARGRTGGRVL